jgi:hypothetical protein
VVRRYINRTYDNCFIKGETNRYGFLNLFDYECSCYELLLTNHQRLCLLERSGCTWCTFLYLCCLYLLNVFLVNIKLPDYDSGLVKIIH